MNDATIKILLTTPLFLYSLVLHAATHHYQLTIDPLYHRLGVHACFGSSTTALQAQDPAAGRLLAQVKLQPKNRYRLSVSGRHLTFSKPLQKKACISYQVDLKLASRLLSQSEIRRFGTDLLLSPSFWLWLPAERTHADQIRIAVSLPAGVAISTPWKPASGCGTKLCYRMVNTPGHWPARIAFGRFRIIRVPAGNTYLRVALLHRQKLGNPSKYLKWLAAAARAVTTLYGEFPDQAPQVFVIPTGHKRSAVPFAQVLRGGGIGIQFFVDQYRPLADFLRDWNATHELSHLFLPFIERADLWLSEGFSTYLQNILMTRARLLTEAENWQLMHNGFRLAQDNAPGKTLRYNTRFMHRDNAYLRVYWSGAAIALLADVMLRRDSGNRQNLGSVLKKFNRCCMDHTKAWSATEVLAKLDALSGTTVFRGLAGRYLSSTRFPELGRLYRELGIRVHGKRISLTERARFSHLRRSLTGSSPQHPRSLSEQEPEEIELDDQDRR